jgi:hypothetical protein
MIDMVRLKTINLNDYTHLLLVNGSYAAIGKDLKKRIANWINWGGILIATQDAATWAESLCFENDGCDEEKDKPEVPQGQARDMAYADFDDQQAQRFIGGAIVSAKVDSTHPVAFGYNSEMSVFRKGTTLLKASENPFSTPVRYTEKPLVSGYIGEQRLSEMSKQPAVIAERHGKGLVVRFANNPLFRGFWRGTERLWVNSLFFGPLVETTQLPK